MKLLKFPLALALWLSLSGFYGCTPTGHPELAVNLPKPAARYAECFNRLTPIPASITTRAQLAQLVAVLRKSELAKTACGKDLLKWYDTVVATYGKG